MLRQYEQENPAAWLELVQIVVAMSLNFKSLCA